MAQAAPDQSSTNDVIVSGINGDAIVIINQALPIPRRAAPAPVVSHPAVKAPTPVKAPVSVAPTLVGSVLENIPDANGLDISGSVSSHFNNASLWDRIKSMAFSNPFTTTPYRDAFKQALVDLGVPANSAGTFTYDGKFTDTEAVIAMADIGNTAFADVVPRKTTIGAMAALSKTIETKNGIAVTDDMKLGLARFEEGMLGVLDRRMKAPHTELTDLFRGAVDKASIALEGIVDFVAESAKAIAAAPAIH